MLVHFLPSAVASLPCIINSWKMKKLTYEERKANLVERLNAVNKGDEE